MQYKFCETLYNDWMGDFLLISYYLIQLPIQLLGSSIVMVTAIFMWHVCYESACLCNNAYSLIQKRFTYDLRECNAWLLHTYLDEDFKCKIET